MVYGRVMCGVFGAVWGGAAVLGPDNCPTTHQRPLSVWGQLGAQRALGAPAACQLLSGFVSRGSLLHQWLSAGVGFLVCQ